MLYCKETFFQTQDILQTFCNVSKKNPKSFKREMYPHLVNYLESYLRNSGINSKVLLHDSIIVLVKKTSKLFTEKMLPI